MNTLGNILWFIFGGLFSGILWLLAGLIWCITIIGIPIGLQCFKFASLAMWPFGKEIVYGSGMFSLLVNVIWIVFFRFGNGGREPDPRLPVVHHDYRDSVREAVFQAGAAVADAVWRADCQMIK